eukprot:Hpha_TRINITY_DN15687_c5_g3::TRINITY_DN15687_c5_g3_i1::g.99106::m.99106
MKQAQFPPSRRPAEVSFLRPCPHNAWDDVRTRKGCKVLRCRVCQELWRLPSGLVHRCQPFFNGCCPHPTTCRLLHIFRQKETLEERQANFGAALVTRRARVPAAGQKSPAMVPTGGAAVGTPLQLTPPQPPLPAASVHPAAQLPPTPPLQPQLPTPAPAPSVALSPSQVADGAAAAAAVAATAAADEEAARAEDRGEDDSTSGSDEDGDDDGDTPQSRPRMMPSWVLAPYIRRSSMDSNATVQTPAASPAAPAVLPPAQATPPTPATKPPAPPTPTHQPVGPAPAPSVRPLQKQLTTPLAKPDGTAAPGPLPPAIRLPRTSIPLSTGPQRLPYLSGTPPFHPGTGTAPSPLIMPSPLQAPVDAGIEAGMECTKSIPSLPSRVNSSSRQSLPCPAPAPAPSAGLLSTPGAPPVEHRFEDAHRADVRMADARMADARVADAEDAPAAAAVPDADEASPDARHAEEEGCTECTGEDEGGWTRAAQLRKVASSGCFSGLQDAVDMSPERGRAVTPEPIAAPLWAEDEVLSEWTEQKREEAIEPPVPSLRP